MFFIAWFEGCIVCRGSSPSLRAVVSCISIQALHYQRKCIISLQMSQLNVKCKQIQPKTSILRSLYFSLQLSGDFCSREALLHFEVWGKAQRRLSFLSSEQPARQAFIYIFVGGDPGHEEDPSPGLAFLCSITENGRSYYIAGNLTRASRDTRDIPSTLSSLPSSRGHKHCPLTFRSPFPSCWSTPVIISLSWGGAVCPCSGICEHTAYRRKMLTY